MIAQLPDPSSFSAIGWIFVCLVGLVVGANQIDDFMKRRRGHPANEVLKGTGDVLAQRMVACEREQQEGVERRRKIYEKIEGVQQRVRDETKTDFGKVYDKIDETRKELSTDIDALRREMNNLPDRIIANLRNLGHLK